MAHLHFKYGAMNSGKSDTLIKTAYNYTEQGLHIATIKPSIDTKGGNKITARAGGSWSVDILADADTNLRSKIQALATDRKIDTFDCILVDESQFLSPKQIDQLFRIAKQDNISVIAYGLRADFRSKAFPGSKRLFELADNIEKLPTMCHCGNQAEFNCRTIDGEFTFQGSQIAIDDGHDTQYTSICGNCYINERAKQLT